MASLEEAWHADILGEGEGEALREGAAVTGESKAEWAAEDDAIWLEFDSVRNEAEQHALDDIVPSGAVGDFFDEFAVTGTDSTRSGEVFPFVLFAVVGVVLVARLEILVLAG